MRCNLLLTKLYIGGQILVEMQFEIMTMELPTNLPGKDGKQARTIREQIGYVYLGGKFPVEMKLSLQDDRSAYKSGNYELDSSSFTVNRG